MNKYSLINYLARRGGYIEEENLKSALTYNTFIDFINNIWSKTTDFIYFYDNKSNILVEPKNLERRFSTYNKIYKSLNNFRHFVTGMNLDSRYSLILIKVDDNACYIVKANIDSLSICDEQIYFDFSHKGQHNWFFDTNKIREKKTGKKYANELNLTDPLDFTSNNQILLDFPALISAKDILKEKRQSEYNKFKLTINWSDCVNKANRIQVFEEKWKRFHFLEDKINVNKYNTVELSMLRQMQTKLTQDEFIKVINFYSQSRGNNVSWFKWTRELADHLSVERYLKEQWLFIYALYILDRTNCLSHRLTYNSQEYFTVLDYCKNYLVLHPNSLECPYRSYKRLCRVEHEVTNDVVAIKVKKKYGKKAKVLSHDSMWDKLRKNINHSDMNICLLDSPQKLLLEGQRQHNCVGTYIGKVIENKSCILHYEDKTGKYTVEVEGRKRRNKPGEYKYKVIQIFRTNNEMPAEGVDQRINKMLNN